MYRYRLLAGLVVISLGLAACGGTPTSAPPTQIAPTEHGERVLVLWTHEYPTFTSGLRDKWIPEFEASHPGVQVEYQAFPYSGAIVSFDTKLLAEVASGGGPDVWAMASHNFTQAKYIEAGLLAPLDPRVFGYTSVEELVNDYPRNSLSVFVRGEKSTHCSTN